MSDDGPTASRARLWALPAGLFVAVVGIVLALAFTHPAKPGLPKDSGAPVTLGNPADGHAIFNSTCSGCHGQNGTGGGIGPTLKGANVSLARAKAIIDAGSGAMPPGLVGGARQADVLAYLNTIFAGGGQAAPPPPPPPPTGSTASTADSAADRGHDIFNKTCAGCHGQNGSGGGIGPRLQGADVSVDQARQIIDAGSAPMPPKLVTGARQEDVLAYLATIFKSGQTGTTPPPTGTTAAPVTSGSAQLLGQDFTRLRIVLAGPSPKAWTVWAHSASGFRRIGALPAGSTRRTITAPAAVGSLLEGYDQIVVGASTDQPALVAQLSEQSVNALRGLLVTAGAVPGAGSLRDGAAGQLGVLLDHVRFLQQAQAEQNVFNVRLHGEHLVNIVRGNPIVDLDGNGQASNPGDGLGLLGQPNGYLPRIRAASAAVGGSARAAPRATTAANRIASLTAAEQQLLQALAANARLCGSTQSLARSRVPVATVARLAQQARRQQAAAARQLPFLATFTLSRS